ncbi:FAD-binding oxidoreductase [Paucibacter sp. O1-1]|nr:FAD-binding oxidoreductase [Paucibacter sp. O1-1]MDA3825044.1 FAD-binding oxidoreductase [Paucibacter sp. O1-1]
MRAQLIDQLIAISGENNVLTQGDLSAYLQDWRKWWEGRAVAIVRPKTTQEVALIVKACAQENVTIVPQGGNTGLVGGSIPDSSGTQVVIQLGRMNSVVRIDKANMTVTVQAGCVLASLQQQAREAGFLFPLSLGAEGSCMIGGNLATNAGGTQVLRYGNTRDLCLGLEVVTPSGEVLNTLSGLRKDNTGYNLRDLFIGSEGTLGIITAATLKLYPLPAANATSWAAVPDVDKAVELLGLAQNRLGSSLTGFELMCASGLHMVTKHLQQLRVPFSDDLPPYSILLECSGSESADRTRSSLESLLEEALQRDLISNVVVAETFEQSKQLWSIREHIPLAQVHEGPNVKHDISLPISSIPEFLARSASALCAAIPGVRIVNFGHLGDGNLHYNVLGPEGEDAKRFLADHEDQVTEIVYRTVADFGGSFSAEHGVGAIKVHALETYKCPCALDLMRSIKKAIDPHNLMNPGRVLAATSARPIQVPDSR